MRTTRHPGGRVAKAASPALVATVLLACGCHGSDFHARDIRVSEVSGVAVDPSDSAQEGAAKGLWTRNGETRFFGCRREECRPLVIWEHAPPDAEWPE